MTHPYDVDEAPHLAPEELRTTGSGATDVDVVVIGAGAAGLAAARELRAAHLNVTVLEARGRVGGRIFTYRDPAVAAPIELGAEFLHGTTAETDAIVEAAHLHAIDVVGDHWRAEHGTFTDVGDFWKRVDRVLGKLDPHRTPDRSFADFLAEQEERSRDKARRKGKRGGKKTDASRRSTETRRLALEFVQGFHAADPERVSERWLANGGDPGESEEESRTGRLVDGYDRVPAYLARDLFDAIELNTIAEHVQWSDGGVSVRARRADGTPRGVITARAAIVTIPLGVLQADPSEEGAITFDPPLPDEIRTAIDGMAMGPVMRAVFAFEERFWEHGLRNAPSRDALADLSFIHSPGSTVPVWWTQFPLRAPVMVGWVGGPPARELWALGEDEIERRALRDLARHLGSSYERLSSLLVGAWMHDWDRDPFSRGAYSYGLVNGSDAPQVLSRPVSDTLFFAGEATDTEGRTGTVEGALASGRRAGQSTIRAVG